MSADFVASDFIATDELPRLLKAAEGDGTVILPLIISPSLFHVIGGLSRFQAINDPAQPLVILSRGEQEAVFVRLAQAIADILARPNMPQLDGSRTSDLMRASTATKALQPLITAPFKPYTNPSGPSGDNISQRDGVKSTSSEDYTAKRPFLSFLYPFKRRAYLLFIGYQSVGKSWLWNRLLDPEVSRQQLFSLSRSSSLAIIRKGALPLGRFEVFPSYIDVPGGMPGVQLAEFFKKRTSIWILLLATTPLGRLAPTSSADEKINHDYIAHQLGHLSLLLAVLSASKVPRPQLVILVISKIDLFCTEAPTGTQTAPLVGQLRGLFAEHIARVQLECMRQAIPFKLEFCSALQNWGADAIKAHVERVLSNQ